MRRLLVPLLTAVMLAAPTAAYAAIGDCPQAVQDVRGTQPTTSQISAALDAAADTHAVPRPLLRAIAYVESGWRQFNPDGTVLASSDDVCGLGIMQITADGYSDSDKVRLASEYEFNIDEGAELLAAKWMISQGTPPPTGAAPDDPDVVENWYYAACLYNGCGTDATYPTKVANTVADPFRYAPNFPSLRPYWFTKPQDAKSDYAFPNAFQARYSPAQEFVFYDHTTGTVSETIAAPTHSLTTTAAPATTYPAGAFGPDGAHVTCEQCGGWRLASGEGLIGRAHWTNTVTGPAQSTMTWQPTLPRSGLYRVSAFVPSAAVGVATYSVDGLGVTVDQEPLNDAWVKLADRTLVPGDSVVVTDHADVAAERIYGDAMRFAAIPVLSLTPSVGTVTYGSASILTARLTHGGVGLSGQPITIYKRKLGTTPWVTVGTFQTSSAGNVAVSVKPTVNAEYTARYTATSTAILKAATVNKRVYVRPRVAATQSATTVRRGTRVTLNTSVAPSHAGSRIYLQRLVGSTWQNVAYATLTSLSRASFFVTPSSAGTFYYRFSLPAHSDHVAGTSGKLTLRVT